MLNQILKDLEHIAANTANTEGFEVVGLQVLAQNMPMTIQVQIRLQDGGDVSLDDCSRLSGAIGESFENSKLADIPHILEISSPGLKDILKTEKEFETFKGFPIEVSQRNKTDSQVIEGVGVV